MVQAGVCEPLQDTDCAVRCRGMAYLLMCLVQGRWENNCSGPHRFLCPEIKYAELVHCSRELGTSCKVQCPNGKISNEEAVCLPTGEWSPLPSCYFRSQCAHEQLPFGTEFVENSCKSSNSFACKVGCSTRSLLPELQVDAPKLLSIKDVNCSSSGRWEGLPNCNLSRELFLNETKLMCPKPNIGKNGILKEHCKTSEGNVCYYRCKQGFFPNKILTIRCSQKKWVGLVPCLEPTCPHLPNNLLFKHSCSRHIGSKCLLECQKGKLIGNSSVVCESNGKWSGLPRCGTPNKTNSCSQTISPNISFVRHCSFNHGKKCQIKCNHQLLLVGMHFVFCQNGLWKNVPRCIPKNISPYRHLKMKCQYPPRLYGNLKILGVCKSDGGFSCDLGCRDPYAKMVGANATTCLTPGLWSKIDPCENGIKYCPQPILQKEFETEGDCLGKQVGSKCQIRCKHRPVLTFTIVCTEKEKWSLPKRCYCDRPVLKSGMRIVEKCMNKVGGSNCYINCTEGYTMVGKNYITCQENLQWSILSSCEKIRCQKPNLTQTLMFKDDCTDKTLGEQCNLECREGGNISKPGIKCLDGVRWTDLPICSCPQPSLVEDLRLNHDCFGKRPGEKCFLSCKGKLKLIGQNHIKCRSDSKWSILPKCKRNNCPKIQLPKFLIYGEDCSTVSPGEKCHLECKEGGNIVGLNFVQCDNSLKWTNFPTCTCPLPALSDSLVAIKKCDNITVGGKCFLKCKTPFSLKGNNFTQCQNDTRWSNLPDCKKLTCSKPKLPIILEFSEDCSSKLPGENCKLQCREKRLLLGSNTIQCIGGTKWTTFPKCSCPPPILNQHLVLNENCSNKRVGSRCHLSCREGKFVSGTNYISCKKDTRWSRLPRCKTVFCPKPKLPKELRSNNCVLKKPGENCDLRCSEGGKIIGPDKITCLNATHWSAFPNCTCAKPFLTDDLESKEDCLRKNIGEKCVLTCRENHSLEDKDFIICQKNTRWSTLPKCKKLICPKPKLGKGLDFREDCSSKVIGEECELECKEGGKMFGSKYITCSKISSELKWSDLPTCACPPPILSEELKAVENCSKKIPTETCKLICTNKLTIVGNSTIACQNNTKWNTLPKCKKNICAMPKLEKHLLFHEDCSSKAVGESCSLLCKTGGNLLLKNKILCLNSTHWTSQPECTCSSPVLLSHLKLEENCSMKRSGEVCTITCKKGFKMEPSPKFVCQKDLLWSPLPVCKKHLCSKPILSKNLLLDEDCTTKRPGERCKLTCRKGGRFIGNSSIKCGKDDAWSSLPKCTCPDPYLHLDLKVSENCSFKLPKEKCFLQCIGNLTLVGKNFIICSENNEWSSQPSCEKRVCPKLDLPPHILLAAPCVSETVGTKCKLQCKHGGNLIGESYVKCLNTTLWSKFPLCACPAPKLSDGLEVVSDCSNAIPRKKCQVKCARNLKIKGLNFITCLPMGKWGIKPKCEKILCITPHLTSELLFDEDCSRKSTGESCRLKCKNKGRLLGTKQIRCVTKDVWSDLPKCACPHPILRHDIQSTEDCSSKQPGEKCLLTCKNSDITITEDFITCGTGMTWSTLPICKKNSCMNLVLPPFLEFKNECSSKFIGDSCEVSCKSGGNIDGSSLIKCTSVTEWTAFPRCPCAIPSLEENLSPVEDCSNVFPGSDCKLQCKPSFDMIGPSITCLNSTEWSKPPICKKQCCAKPQLPSYLQLDSSCSSKLSQSCDFREVKEECIVKCKFGGIVRGKDKIKCVKAPNEWNQFPDCFCRELKIEPPLRKIGTCAQKRRGGRCKVECSSGFHLVGNSTLHCQRDAQWSVSPICRKDICSQPNFQKEIFNVEGDCMNKTIGEECRLFCKEGGKVIGNNIIKCLSKKEWSPFPDCTCPTPKLPNYLKSEDSCDSKKPNEKCSLECRDGLLLEGNDFIMCKPNTKWTSFPKCGEICDEPKLNEQILSIEGECVRKKVGEECHVRCRERGKLIGHNGIKCLVGKKWSPFPDCTCPPPELPNDLKSKDNCDSKKPNEKCSLECRDGLLLEGNDFIMCQSNTKWGDFPTCKEICDEPKLNEQILSIEGECVRKKVGEECHVRCRERGKLIGHNGIKCLVGKKWSPFPDCTCPPPELPNDLKSKDNCDSKKPNEKCSLECRDGLLLEGNDFIMCQPNTKWTSFPKCGEICDEPKLNEQILSIEGECIRKKVGEECHVRCRERGKLIGHNGIKCLVGKKWSPFPDCTCPPPELPNDLKSKDNCDSKKPNEKCSLECRDGLLLEGNDFIMCQSNTKWGDFPTCKEICKEPQLPKEVLKVVGNCSKKYPGESCRVSCKQGGTIIGSNVIVCLGGVNGNWSTFPTCTCKAPRLSGPLLVFKESCNLKKVNETCEVGCKEGFYMRGNSRRVLCQENTKWRVKRVKKCKPKYCRDISKVKLRPYLRFKENCSRKRPNSTCALSCVGGGKLLGTQKIKCGKSGWTRYRSDCRCPALNLTEGLKTKGDCNDMKRGYKCLLECKTGYIMQGPGYIICHRNAYWTKRLPKCQKITSCPVPVLPSSGYLTIQESCRGKVPGEMCQVNCTHGGSIFPVLKDSTILLGHILCQDDLKWSPFPECTCPILVLPSHVILRSSCQISRVNDTCLVGCDVGFDMTGSGVVTCQMDGTWTGIPECRRWTCPKPNFRGGAYKLEEACEGKGYNEFCKISCQHGGRLIGPNRLRCNAYRDWSAKPVPVCNCPVPKLNPNLATFENCDDMAPLQICYLYCTTGFAPIESTSITCNAVASWTEIPHCSQLY